MTPAKPKKRCYRSVTAMVNHLSCRKFKRMWAKSMKPKKVKIIKSSFEKRFDKGGASAAINIEKSIRSLIEREGSR